MEFKDILRRVMRKGRWTSVLLSEKTGINASAISHFLNGRRKPSYENLKKLCIGLETCPSILLDLGGLTYDG